MPAFSGLYNGVFGENYAPITSPRPPISGVLRVLMQKHGMFGMVRGFGRNAPDSIAVADTDRNDMIVRGGYDYANREEDAANKVTIVNIGGDVNTLTTRAMPATATATFMKRTADTHKNRAYAADAANTGVTATALAEVYDT